jgi:hypothetical protein
LKPVGASAKSQQSTFPRVPPQWWSPEKSKQNPAKASLTASANALKEKKLSGCSLACFFILPVLGRPRSRRDYCMYINIYIYIYIYIYPTSPVGDRWFRGCVFQQGGFTSPPTSSPDPKSRVSLTLAASFLVFTKKRLWLDSGAFLAQVFQVRFASFCFYFCSLRRGLVHLSASTLLTVYQPIQSHLGAKFSPRAVQLGRFSAFLEIPPALWAIGGLELVASNMEGLPLLLPPPRIQNPDRRWESRPFYLL